MCFFSGLLLQAQEIQISRNDKSFFKDLISFDLREDLSDGVYLVYYDSLKTRLELSATILNGKRTGAWTWYFETGATKRMIAYQNGLFNGEVKSFYPEGQISASSFYEMGTVNGLAVRWFANGVKKSEGVVLNGKPTGLWKYWKEDGSLLLEIGRASCRERV